MGTVSPKSSAARGSMCCPSNRRSPTMPFRPDYRDLAASGLQDRFIVTPYAAWSSPESRADARRLSVQTAMMYLQTGKLRNLVNGEYLRDPRSLG
jgi:D-3-phosphoglycerate dehydrogenase